MKSNAKLTNELKKEIIKAGYSSELEISNILRAVFTQEMPPEICLGLMKDPRIEWYFQNGEVWMTAAKINQ